MGGGRGRDLSLLGMDIRYLTCSEGTVLKMTRYHIRDTAIMPQKTAYLRTSYTSLSPAFLETILIGAPEWFLGVAVNE